MFTNILMSLAKKIGLQRRINWYLTKINYSKKFLINGARIRIPSIQGIACDMTEGWMVELLVNLKKCRPGAFLDVGVNVGQTLIKVKAIDPDGDYFGLEPNPVCVNYLQSLIKLNDFKGCTIVPVGIFNRDCILTLDLFSDNAADAMASLVEDFRPMHKVFSRVLVPVFQFESIKHILGSKSFGILKIDVEGAELEVVKSLSELIYRDQPAVIIELLPVHSNDNLFRLDRQEELERLLVDMGYSIFRVGKALGGAYAGLSAVEKIGVHSDLTQCDYVLIPTAQIHNFQSAVHHTRKNAA